MDFDYDWKHMPHAATAAEELVRLGAGIRAQRKRLRISSIATAEVAGVSRVTLHRIEKGEPGVAIGAWVRVIRALGLHFSATTEPAAAPEPAAETGAWLPTRIRLADYPQLRSVAWHIQGIDTLRPQDAHALYQRNARHLEPDRMSPAEHALLQALNTVFGDV